MVTCFLLPLISAIFYFIETGTNLPLGMEPKFLVTCDCWFDAEFA